MPESFVPALRALGYEAAEKSRTICTLPPIWSTLREKRTDRPRAACNRFVREHGGVLEPYDCRDQTACVSLFREWREQKLRSGSDEWANALLEDAVGAHETALSAHSELG